MSIHDINCKDCEAACCISAEGGLRLSKDGYSLTDGRGRCIVLKNGGCTKYQDKPDTNLKINVNNCCNHFKDKVFNGLICDTICNCLEYE